MKIVADSNVALSGLLWGGPPNQILKWCRDRNIHILECDETLDEVKRVLQSGKFSRRLTALHTTAPEIISYFMNLITFVPSPRSIPEAIEADPFDNIFLALASEHSAHLIVSGDRHLLELNSFQDIQIVTPAEAVRVLASFL